MPDRNNRTRGQKLWDTAITSAIGTFMAAVIIGVVGGGWNMYTTVQRLETSQRATSSVITDKLAHMEAAGHGKGLSRLERRVAELEARLVSQEETFASALGDLVDALAQDDPAMLKGIPDKYPVKANGGQSQLPESAPNEPFWKDYEDARRGIQEQIQQQEEWLK